jgi:hypothetical protein
MVLSMMATAIRSISLVSASRVCRELQSARIGARRHWT